MTAREIDLTGWDQERFYTKIVNGLNGCWNWNAGLTNGYGRFYLNGVSWYAHRVCYTHLRGPVPLDLTLDHLCRNRQCANPAHLEVVSSRANILRGTGLAAQNKTKFHCPKGHTYDMALKRKGRACRVCLNAVQRKRNNSVGKVEYLREWHRCHPSAKAEISKRYLAKNSQKIAGYKRGYYLKHKADLAEYQRQYRLKKKLCV